MACAPSIPRQNFSCLTRLDHNRAKAQAALKVRGTRKKENHQHNELTREQVGTNVTNVKNVIIWGNHSATQYAPTGTVSDPFLAHSCFR